MEDLPIYSTDLIKKLDELFPEKCPAVTDSEREIWMYAGLRKLVSGLVQQLKHQEENSTNV